MTYSVSCLVLYTVFIEFAYLCSGDLFDSVVLEIFHEIDSVLMDHVCTYGITELDHRYIMLLLAQECSGLTSYHSTAHNKNFFACWSLSVQKIRTVDDGRIVDSLDRKDQSLGTRCDDHTVRFLLFDKLRSYLTVHHDLHAVFLAAVDIAADHVCDITFSWWISRKSHVSAENISCFIKCYFVSFLFCDKCSAKSCNTTADHHNFLRILCLSNWLCLMSKKRVGQTANRVSCIHVCNTSLKTGDTWSHILQTLFQCFFRHSRICKALTAKCYKVCSSFFYHQFCKLWLCITSDCDHRNVYRTFDLLNL